MKKYHSIFIFAMSLTLFSHQIAIAKDNKFGKAVALGTIIGIGGAIINEAQKQ